MLRGSGSLKQCLTLAVCLLLCYIYNLVVNHKSRAIHTKPLSFICFYSVSEERSIVARQTFSVPLMSCLTCTKSRKVDKCDEKTLQLLKTELKCSLERMMVMTTSLSQTLQSDDDYVLGVFYYFLF